MKPLKSKFGMQGLLRNLVCLQLAAGLVAACEPTVKLEAPKEPITINLNIKLEADVVIRIEEKAQEDIAANPDVF